MKNISKQFGIIALVGIIGFSQAACAKHAQAQQTNPESDFTARPIGGGVAVEFTGYVGNSWDVHIPPRIQNLPVTHIGREAFREKNLVKVTIPNSITSIGVSAFEDNKLTSITIGANVIMQSGINEQKIKIDSFDNNFPHFYTSSGRKAGTYTLSGNQWSFRP